MTSESVYRGTAFIKERINLKALKLLEKFLAPACCCDALVFLFYRSPVTPLPERRRNTLLRYYAFAPGDQRRYVLLVRRTSALATPSREVQRALIIHLAFLWSCAFFRNPSNARLPSTPVVLDAL